MTRRLIFEIDPQTHQKTEGTGHVAALIGCNINKCVPEVIALAQAQGRTVTLHFNDIKVPVHPTDTPENVIAVFADAIQRRQEAYRASPAYKEQLAKRAHSVASKQKMAIELFLRLPEAVKDPAELCMLLADLSIVSDDTDIKIDAAAFVAAIEAEGYVTNAHVYEDGDRPEFTPRMEIEWAVGQCLRLLKTHGFIRSNYEIFCLRAAENYRKSTV